MTSEPVEGVVITALGNMARCTADELADMQRIVGGYVEAVDVSIADQRCTIWLNEEGKLSGLPLNPSATKLAEGRLSPDDYIVGDVLITGGTGPEGETLPIPAEARDALLYERDSRG